MSTRCTTHFKYGKETEAIIFRHTDGYPSVAGAELKKFLQRCKALPDSRLNDASMLAARYVVFLAEQFAVNYIANGTEPKADRLDFISVRVLMRDTDDVAYRYEVDCAKIGPDGLPKVRVIKCF